MVTKVVKTRKLEPRVDPARLALSPLQKPLVAISAPSLSLALTGWEGCLYEIDATSAWAMLT